MPWPFSQKDPQRVRLLGRSEYGAALEVCKRAGSEGVLAGARLAERARFLLNTGEAWALGRGTGMTSLCWSGANVMPVSISPDDIEGYCEFAQGRPVRASAFVGDAETVLAMWRGLRAHLPQEREIRPNQPLMEIISRVRQAEDLNVRVARPDEYPIVLPASVAMFTEELGFSPLESGSWYPARVRELIAEKYTYIRTGPAADGSARVVFKADVGAALGECAQIHGVWTAPDCRGRGIATAGMACVVEDLMRRGFSVVSLYVNSFNAAALAAYRKVGFEQIGRWATVMI